MGDIFGGPSKIHKSDQTVANSNSFSTGTNESTGSSQSYNRAYDPTIGAIGKQATTGSNASDFLSALLGVSGGDQQNAAFHNYQASTGYQAGLNQGIDGIVGSNAAKGLLNSGATGKAINLFGQNYANSKFQDYANNLQSLIGNGNSVAGILGNMGNISNSNSHSFGATNSGSTSQSNGISLEDSKGESKGWGDMAGQVMGDIAKMFL